MAVDVALPRPEFVAWRRNPSSELQWRTGQLESGAVVVRWFDPGVVPGLLQTRDYAHAVLDVCVGDEGDVAVALEQRLARQRRWRVSEGRTHFVLGEQAQYTIVGNRTPCARDWRCCCARCRRTRLWASCPGTRTFTPH